MSHGPRRLQVTAEGETYYRYGVMLKKVANFYNNMASQVFTNESNGLDSFHALTLKRVSSSVESSVDLYTVPCAKSFGAATILLSELGRDISVFWNSTTLACTLVVIEVRVFGCSCEGDPRAKADASGFLAGL